MFLFCRLHTFKDHTLNDLQCKLFFLFYFLVYFLEYAIVRTLSVRLPVCNVTTFHGVNRLRRFMVRSIAYGPRTRTKEGIFFWNGPGPGGRGQIPLYCVCVRCSRPKKCPKTAAEKVSRYTISGNLKGCLIELVTILQEIPKRQSVKTRTPDFLCLTISIKTIALLDATEKSLFKVT